MNRRLGWRQQAACRFDPGGHWDGDLLPSMFEICMGCPVRSDCLMEALHHEERSDCGVWGGTGPDERRRIRRGGDPEKVWAEVRRSLAQERMLA
jgi:WhiB family redox-sensing transcriptional regulator